VTLSPANTAVVLDSTADFANVSRRFANAREVPLYVRFGDESLRDHVDIAPGAFYERLAATTELPTTSQPTPHDFLAAYEELVSAGFERIYSIHLSSKLSGTCQSASLAAAELGGDRVVVIDTGTVSLACALLALAIERRLSAGTTPDELDALIGRFRRDVGVIFTVGTLEYLQRGGRIGRAQALAGSLLHVRPILAIRDGEVVPVARARGRQKALEEFARVFLEATTGEPGLRVAIAHADAPEWVDVLRDLVTKARPSAEIELVETLGAVIGTHAGPGAVGFFWFHDRSAA
jgi:fatty acid kinase fatty acid binding subunit